VAARGAGGSKLSGFAEKGGRFGRTGEEDRMWNQVYDPFNNTTASTIAAALPVVTLLVLIASNKVKIVVASTATNWFGHEGTILRFVFGHSIALACLVGILVMLQAYVFTGMIVQ
jgi:hypothetical protein